jgi:NAD(P)-dependent dehydrogenase (short-subunit alcohol dehydrogenase family)
VDLVASEWLLADDPQIGQLVAEITTGAPIAAYRRGHRWLESLEPVRLNEVGVRGPSRLRDRGVYLITGGLGGVGLTLADYLARAVRARLVLIGRHGLPDRTDWASYVARHGDDDRLSRKIHVIDALERTGAEVMVVAADVSNIDQMRAAAEAVQQRYGRLDGVIHAAGVAGGGVIQLKTPEEASRVLAPKVGGTLALSQAVAGLDLDFFVLCSSSVSLFGGGGQVDYCAANAYLDAFAREYARRTGIHTVAINWDAWQRVGMAVETAVEGQMAREREAFLLTRGMTPEEGAEVFRRVLAHCTVPQIAVSTVSVARLIGAKPKATGASDAGPVEGPRPGAADADGHSRPDLSSPYSPPTSEIERAMCEIWQQMLGIDRIGIHDDFFELGGHSLLATQIVSRVRERCQLELSLKSFFESATIARLADSRGAPGLMPNAAAAGEHRKREEIEIA